MEVVVAGDGLARCWRGASGPDYVAYHDDEWGYGVTSDARLFEKLCLEGFQSGLSWLTILRKREGFRRAFADFDPELVAGYGEREIEQLLDDAAIVRHRGKIEAAINNARRLLELLETEGSLLSYVRGFEPSDADRPAEITHAWLMQQGHTDASRRLAKDLKRRGWAFVGPTTVYAFMQAMGLVNDHLTGCDSRASVEEARAKRPPLDT
jgi:DNA-3-methyladenine glycosylase I